MSDALRSVFRAWSEPDAAKRAGLVAPHVAEPFYYVDPHAPEAVTSVAGFNDFIQAFTEKVPGATAMVVTVDGHHHHLRAIVDFMRQGVLMVRGQYYAETNVDGRITRLVGFVGTGVPE